jgi:hypothetical protein
MVIALELFWREPGSNGNMKRGKSETDTLGHTTTYTYDMTGAHLSWKQMVLLGTLFQNIEKIKSIAVH